MEISEKDINALKNKKDIIILGIESSCDETSISVVKNGTDVLSNIVASQIDIHKLYGGVVPEIASRNHVNALIPSLDDALKTANIKLIDIDAIAVTYGAGLVGALLVGLNFAKGLSFALNKPLIPINHIGGHICSNFITYKDFTPPFVCLITSGGHTAIIIQHSYNEQTLLGQTKDDAVGECFDKVARVLGISYPGGPNVDKLATLGKNNIIFTKHNVLANTYDSSFSGLKTAVINYVHTKKMKNEEININDVCASFQSQALDGLIEKTIKACLEYKIYKIALAGGVAGNSYLRRTISSLAKEHNIEVYLPQLSLCGDNAAMIASAGYYKLKFGNIKNDLSINAEPSLKITNKSIITN